jgi:Mrp family chromosome partitioning ATPase
MSQNFELLKQIEIESGTTDSRLDDMARIATDTAAPQHGVNARQKEMMQLVQRVFLSDNGSAPRLVVFCGVDGESGSSSVCADAGQMLATKSSRAVCLVDANISSPRLSAIFGVDTVSPISDKAASVREQCVQINGNLWLAGTDVLSDDRGALPSVDELKQRLAQLRGGFEYVLIDAPGTSVCGNAALLGQVADAAILVIEANSTRRLTARKAKETLEGAGVRLLGTVLRNRSFPIPERLYKRL